MEPMIQGSKSPKALSESRRWDDNQGGQAENGGAMSIDRVETKRRSAQRRLR